MSTKQMTKIGKMKVRFYHLVSEMTVYESHTGVLCVRKSDIRKGGQCYYKLHKNPKVGQPVEATPKEGYARVKTVEPKYRTDYGKVYTPPLTSEQKKKKAKRKARKQGRREKLVEKLMTHLTKTERKMLLNGKARLTREDLGL